MGARGAGARKKGAQGIRKARGSVSRKDPNRQRLAKVVAREEERTEREARARTRVVQASERASEKWRRGLAAGFTVEHEDDHHKSHRDSARRTDEEDGEPAAEELAAQAYEKLRDSLLKRDGTVLRDRHSGVDAGVAGASVTTDAAVGEDPVKTNAGESEAASDEEPMKTSTGEGQAARVVVSSLEDMSGAAAAREARHFGRELPPSEVAKTGGRTYASSSTEEVAGAGKVTVWTDKADAAVEAERLSAAGATRHFVNALGIQPGVLARWADAAAAEPSVYMDPGVPLSTAEATLVHALASYRDVLQFRPLQPADEARARQLVVGHCVAHAVRARRRVVRNDARLRDSDGGEDAEDGDARDQGFARARVLYLVPMRNDAYDVVRALCRFSVGTSGRDERLAQIGNKERFEEEFGGGTDSEGDDGSGDAEGAKARQPPDHEHRFRGNVDDDFKLGIAFNSKSVRLFTDFYASDVIVASPLGLVRSMQAKRGGAAVPGAGKARAAPADGKLRDEWVMDGADAAARKRKAATHERDDDGFLSSIEVCVVDGAHAFAMQNWDTLVSALRMVNNMPTNSSGTDFARVRPWALDGRMRDYRQTIVLAAQRKAEVSALFRRLNNHAGRIRIVAPEPEHSASVRAVTVPVPQRFLRVHAHSDPPRTPADAPDARFRFFMNNVLPQLRAAADAGRATLVAIPSYHDFVRVRNALVHTAQEDPTFRFASICEYSKPSDVSRTRSRLYNAQVRLVLITERFHYYFRYVIRGASVIVWYAPPENAHFYPEIVNTLGHAAHRGNAVEAFTLFNALDRFALARVIGARRASAALADAVRNTYLYA